MKNILIVWTDNWPWDSRIQKQIDSLLKNGNEVHLACKNTNFLTTRECLGNLFIHRIHNTFRNKLITNILSIPFFLNPIWFFHLLKIILEVTPKVILVRDIPLILPCMVIAKMLNIKIILDMAENFPEMMKFNKKYNSNFISRFLIKNLKIYKHIEKIAVTSVDHIYAVVEESSKRLQEEYKLSESKISIVSNTPTVLIPYNNKNKETKTLNLIYTGNIDAEFRGIEQVIDAFEYLQDYHVVFNLIGDGPMKNLYIEKVKNLKLENINFLGYMEHNNLLNFLATQDIGIVPHKKCRYIDTTIPNKLFDYMLYSLPVIVSSAKPLKRIVEEENCGYVYENSEDLINTLKYIIDNREELSIKSKNGYKAVINKYNWKNDEKKMLSVVESLIKG